LSARFAEFNSKNVLKSKVESVLACFVQLNKFSTSFSTFIVSVANLVDSKGILKKYNFNLYKIAYLFAKLS
jgi:hypothetical protein